MSDKEIIKVLKEISRCRKLAYISNSVQAKLLRNTLKESIFSKNLVEDAFARSVPVGPQSMTDWDNSPPRSGGTLASKSKVSSEKFREYPAPDVVEDDMMKAVDADALRGDDPAVVFGTGSGPGTYRDLLQALKAAEDAADGAAADVSTADDMISSFVNVYPTLDPPDKMRVRSAARAYILGFKKDLQRKQARQFTLNF